MQQTTLVENTNRIRFAPTEFYDNCDQCESLPEERWDSYRQNLQVENQLIREDRQQVCLFIGLKISDNRFVFRDRTNSQKMCRELFDYGRLFY